MSAFGPKRTSLVAPHMSAFGGKADIVIALQNVCNGLKVLVVFGHVLCITRKSVIEGCAILVLPLRHDRW